MADTVESLRTELDALRKEFEDFKALAMPVIDSHKPIGPAPRIIDPRIKRQ